MLTAARAVTTAGLAWLTAVSRELRPSHALVHWTRPERAWAVVAECTIAGWLATRLAGGLYRPLGEALLADIHAGACVELMDLFADAPARWFHPLLATTGALAAAGRPHPEATRRLRAALNRVDLAPHTLRLEQILELRYWLAQCGLLGVPYAQGLAEEFSTGLVSLAARVASPARGFDPAAVYSLTHAVFYRTEFGQSPARTVPPPVVEALAAALPAALAARDVDVAAECLFAAWCAREDLAAEPRAFLRLVDTARRASGAVWPATSDCADAGGSEAERCHHGTIAVVLAGMTMS